LLIKYNTYIYIERERERESNTQCGIISTLNIGQWSWEVVIIEKQSNYFAFDYSLTGTLLAKKCCVTTCDCIKRDSLIFKYSKLLLKFEYGTKCVI